jgi:two-component system, OmpR family, response regulator RegX3
MDVGGESVRVLVIEDEESYRAALSSGLRLEGFDVDVAPDGSEGLRLFADRPPDIVLLDMLLPGMHGMEVCRRMRAIAPVPIVMVSAVDTELDVVLGLELGAADYVTKPFRLRELVARMQAILRRVSPPADTFVATNGSDLQVRNTEGYADHTPPITAFGTVRVDFVRREVTVDGHQTHLSRREFDLLAVLLTPARRVRTRAELIDLLWPDRYLSDSRTLDTHIHRLRAKLEPDPAQPEYILTVRGVGFRIEPDGTHPTPLAPSTFRSPDDVPGSGSAGRGQPVPA